MNTLQLVLFSTFSLLSWATVIPITRDYLPPTDGRTLLHSSGNSQQYYPNRPLITTGGYYQPGLANLNVGGGGLILGLNTGQGHYYNPGNAGGVSAQYNPGYGGQYYNQGLGGGAGSGHYYTQGLGGGAGAGHYYNQGLGGGAASGQYYNPSNGGGFGYYNTGLGNGGLFAQAQIVKPGYQPRSVIASDDGYIYGKKK